MGRAAEQLELIISRIDARNRNDPNTETAGGVEYPQQLLYAQRMSSWLERLRPDAGDSLRIAVRAQHIERWVLPRSEFPADRRGYLRWRTTLARHHAELTAELMQETGYDDQTIAAVQSLLRKEGLAGADAESNVQVLEDVACLVFIEHYLLDFATKHPADKIRSIAAKTWRKMSPAAHDEALQLQLPASARELLLAFAAGDE